MIPDFEKAAEDWKAAGKSKEEIKALLSILDRRRFAAMYFKDPVTRRQWKVRGYQEESINWYGPRKIHRSARSTGKTKDLEICVLNAAMTDAGQEALVGTQREAHLEPMMERLVRIVETVPDFKQSLKRRPQRSPDYKIEFKNNFIIWGRIAGPFGQNFQAMHVKYQFSEEAQEWTDKAWREFIPGLNPGGWRWIYGVPNGVRNKYYSYTEDSSYKLFSWSRLLDKSLSVGEIEELKRDYGGEGSPDYQHLVLGLHGRRRIASFDYDDYQLCVNKSLHCPVMVLGLK